MNKVISTPIAIIIIVVLAILVGGSIIWQYLDISKKETSEIEELEDETADWETYRNEEYGFEFNYPSDYSLKEEDASSNPHYFWAPIQALKRIFIGGYNISIKVSKNDNNLSVNEWLNYINDAPALLEIYPDQNRKTIYISLAEGIETMRFACCLSCYREIHLPKNGKIYSLEIGGSFYSEEKKEKDAVECYFTKEDELLFNQILSTFKFIE